MANNNMNINSKMHQSQREVLKRITELAWSWQGEVTKIAARVAGTDRLTMSGALYQTHEPLLPDYIQQGKVLAAGGFGRIYALDDNRHLDGLKGAEGVVKVSSWLRLADWLADWLA